MGRVGAGPRRWRVRDQQQVYEYAATGLPIVSAHAPESAAAAVLASYPGGFPIGRWTRPTSPPHSSRQPRTPGPTPSRPGGRPAVRAVPDHRPGCRRFDRGRPMSRVQVVVLHGGSSRQRAAWAVVRRLTGPDTAVTAFFADSVPPGRPKRVAAYPVEPSPAPPRRNVARYLRWRSLQQEAHQAAGDPTPTPCGLGRSPTNDCARRSVVPISSWPPTGARYPRRGSCGTSTPMPTSCWVPVKRYAGSSAAGPEPAFSNRSNASLSAAPDDAFGFGATPAPLVGPRPGQPSPGGCGRPDRPASAPQRSGRNDAGPPNGAMIGQSRTAAAAPLSAPSINP